MNLQTYLYRLTGLALGLSLIASPGAIAQDFAADQKPSRDPFLTLIVKKRKVKAAAKPTAFRPPPPTRARIPPLVIKISTVISSGDENLAVIEYKGQDYVVGKGWDGSEETGFDKRFRVVEVEEEKIVVYDTKAKQRRTIRDGDSGPGSGIELSLN